MLYHELRKIGVPGEIVDWLRRRYDGRKTRLLFDDFVSDLFLVLGGEDQGDPFSAIGYILYAAGIFRVVERETDTEGFGFMDDLAVLMWGKNVDELHKKMGELMEKTGGVLEWAEIHNCEFGIDKFKVVDMTRKREKHLDGRRKTRLVKGKGVKIGGEMVKSDAFARFLGALMDSELRWENQHAEMIRKGQGWVVQFRRLMKVTDGMVSSHVCQLYKAKALPRMLYAADVTLAPWTKASGGRKGKTKQAVLRKLTSIQRQAALIVTGALSSTATDILDIHAGLLPMPLEIERQ
ncbi:hypothetical protein K435DRAFT_684203 [Dendrothele bispora CBS 962.96]|uniref:Reverse transcriptase domain-containing protein n=1 Tax=Dendrothele bispora (strain CBS 962.96) TaxID=1314807 RepID=A0A4S8LBZ0_DENBC|nr:hypothetical protein K435DRAFT_684203 [Dendrothele bispora CBS 962.96]